MTTGTMTETVEHHPNADLVAQLGNTTEAAVENDDAQPTVLYDRLWRDGQD